jgi:hypothetical protein
MDGVGMAQSFRTTVGTVRDACGDHHGADLPPGRHAGHRPEGRIELIGFPAPVGLADVVRQVEVIQEGLRNWNGSEDVPAAFLEGFKNDGLAVQIDASGGEGKGLRDAATCVIEHPAQGADGLIGLGGGGQIQASAFGIVEWGGRVHDVTLYWSSVSRSSQMKLEKAWNVAPAQLARRPGRRIYETEVERVFQASGSVACTCSHSFKVVSNGSYVIFVRLVQEDISFVLSG